MKSYECELGDGSKSIKKGTDRKDITKKHQDLVIIKVRKGKKEGVLKRPQVLCMGDHEGGYLCPLRFLLTWKEYGEIFGISGIFQNLSLSS